MEEFRSLTSSDQILIDNRLTEEGFNDYSRNLPFHFAIKSEVLEATKVESGVSKMPTSYSSSSSSRKNLETPPYHISRSVEYLKNYSSNLQSWRGHIIEKKYSSFIAELEDLTCQGTKEIAEIEFSNVSPDDRSLLDLGAVFYWNIGTKMNRGQISKESIIRFQRVIDWQEEDYDNASDRASELFDCLKFE